MVAGDEGSSDEHVRGQFRGHPRTNMSEVGSEVISENLFETSFVASAG